MVRNKSAFTQVLYLTANARHFRSSSLNNKIRCLSLPFKSNSRVFSDPAPTSCVGWCVPDEIQRNVKTIIHCLSLIF